MIIRLLIWLLLLVGGGAALAVAGRATLNYLRPWRERKRLARRKARLLEAQLEERCVYCNEREPAPDLFNGPVDGWCHSSCYEKIMDETL